MIKVIATEADIKQMIANAVQASLPGGLGHLRYRATEKFSPTQIKFTNGKFVCDWFAGRRVGLDITQVGKTEWDINSAQENIEYQTWMKQYKNYFGLIGSVPEIKVGHSK